MKRIASSIAAIAVLLFASRAVADASEPDVVRRPKPLLPFGVELAFSGVTLEPNLSGVTFSGSGIPQGGTTRIGFSHRGRELGIATPILYGGELSVRYLRRYFAVGLTGFLASHPGGADATPVPPGNHAATLVDDGALNAYGGAIDFMGALTFRNLTFRAGPVLGLRGYSVPLSGFKATSCGQVKGNRTTYPCDETATTAIQGFVQPRASVDVMPAGPHTAFFLGGFVGWEVVGNAAMTGGIYVGFRFDHSELAP